MKVKTLRSILQAGVILAITLLISLAVCLVVQYVELKNLEEKYNELLNGSGSVTASVELEDDGYLL
jgi:hypothetical protein